MVLGHVLNPMTPRDGAAGRLAAFGLALGVLGAWRGWREVAVRASWADAAPPPGTAARGATAGATAALLAAGVAYLVVHGG
jgi:hypothetical protein